MCCANNFDGSCRPGTHNEASRRSLVESRHVSVSRGPSLVFKQPGPALGLVGLTGAATVVAVGTASRSSSKSFGPMSTFRFAGQRGSPSCCEAQHMVGGFRQGLIEAG